jgi:2-keto-4-pentenoate hydratase/2-oxohepta-3-ene-1,7-dioic acid hydratase in catechol pathway
MRFASWIAGAQASWGAVSQEHLADLGPTGAGMAPTLRDAIERDLIATIGDDAVAAAPTVRLDAVTWLPVIPEPRKIICVGVNYHSHREETKHAALGAPTLFIRFADSQAAHNDQVCIPSVSDKFDYEGELAVVIGKQMWQTPAADAMAKIAGYAVFNDFTARDWQRATTQWTAGKNFPGTGALGPHLVTADEIADVSALRLETRVNGVVRQDASVQDLIFDIPRILEYISTFTRLYPGDVIATGTPGGVGIAMDPPGLLKDGDVVEVAISHVGTLRNAVTSAR